MMDYLKENWKTVLVGTITGIVILCLCCCGGKQEAAEAAPVEAVEEVIPAVEEVVPAEVVE